MKKGKYITLLVEYEELAFMKRAVSNHGYSMAERHKENLPKNFVETFKSVREKLDEAKTKLDRLEN